jgi:hypothetical protein
MIKTIRTFICSTFCIIIVLLMSGGCASTGKSYLSQKSKKSVCDLSRLGKGKYFYSASYQRKLKKSEFKIGGKFRTYTR